MDALRDDFITQGYTVKEEGENSILMKKKSWGSAAGWIVSLIVALVLAVFTVGISFIIPLAYAIFAHYNAPEVLIRIVAA
jgi:hypothetical protein